MDAGGTVFPAAAAPDACASPFLLLFIALSTCRMSLPVQGYYGPGLVLAIRSCRQAPGGVRSLAGLPSLREQIVFRAAHQNSRRTPDGALHRRHR